MARQRLRSSYERKIAHSLQKNKVAWTYEAVTLHYLQKVRNGRCLTCSSREVGKSRTYKPDFVIRNGTTGLHTYLETKGRLTSAERTKFAAIVACDPHIDLRLIFQRPKNRINKDSQTTYGDWATGLGLKWAGPDLPKEWIDEFKGRSEK